MKRKPRPCRNGCSDADATCYYASGGCGMAEGCSGWNEQHCSRCGWFISSCPCGCSNGASKISHRAEVAIMKKRSVRRKEEEAR